MSTDCAHASALFEARPGGAAGCGIAPEVFRGVLNRTPRIATVSTTTFFSSSGSEGDLRDDLVQLDDVLASARWGS